MIPSPKVVIYGATYCVFCIKAKNLLKKHNVPVDWIDIQI